MGLEDKRREMVYEIEDLGDLELKHRSSLKYILWWFHQLLLFLWTIDRRVNIIGCNKKK